MFFFKFFYQPVLYLLIGSTDSATEEIHFMHFPVIKLKLKYFMVPDKWQESTGKEFSGIKCKYLFKIKYTFIQFSLFLFKFGVFSYKASVRNMIFINLFGRY